MVELRRRLGLLLEALDDLRVHRDIGRQNLDRDFALECQVVRQEHRAHSAFAEQPLDFVLAFDQALQLLHQPFGPGRIAAHRAAAGDVGAARVAELATVG